MLAAVSAAVAGVVPALRATGKSVQSTIQRARSRRTGARFAGLSGALIVADVAVAVGALGFALTAADLVRGEGPDDGVGIPAEEYLAATVRLSSGAVPRASGSDPQDAPRTRMAPRQPEMGEIHLGLLARRCLEADHRGLCRLGADLPEVVSQLRQAAV